MVNLSKVRNYLSVLNPIESHSQNVVLASIISGGEFRISHIEMIKGVKKGTTGKSYRYDEELVIPIIENTPFEADLETSMAAAMKAYPDSNAVIVRRHGIYVWGKTWQQVNDKSTRLSSELCF